jgi:hypothetical protein
MDPTEQDHFLASHSLLILSNQLKFTSTHFMPMAITQIWKIYEWLAVGSFDRPVMRIQEKWG